MDFTMQKEEFLKGIQKAQNIVEKRSTMPILSNVLLEARDSTLSITATDLEIGFKGSYQAQVATPGGTTISGKKLYEILRSLSSDTVQLSEPKEGTVVIKGGKASFELMSLPPEDYPPLPKHDGVGAAKAQAADLNDMISKALVSVAAEEMRFNLSGVFVEKVSSEGSEARLRFVSTDGHRLSLVDKGFPGIENLALEKGVILPRKGVVELGRLAGDDGEIEFGFEGNSAVFRKGEVVLVMRLVEGTFPDYRLVLPKGATRTLKTSREELSAALKRMGVLLSDKYRGVKFELGGQTLRISVSNPEIGQAEEEIEVEYQGEPLTVGFNARYLSDALERMRSSSVTVGFNEEVNPCQITGEEDPGTLNIVMPMRI